MLLPAENKTEVNGKTGIPIRNTTKDEKAKDLF
jgi:hypothetical protein